MKRLRTPWRPVRLIRLGLAAIAAAYGALVLLTGGWLNADALNEKDFGQEYLLARAILDHVDPYQPIDVLAARYVPVTGYFTKSHPTPHPPSVGVFALPLGLVSYPLAARIWFVLELVCLAGSVALLTRTAGWRLPLASTPLLTLALIGWAPISLELGLGQLMLPLLVALAAAQAALLRGSSAAGGALYALTLLIKPLAWPWLLVLGWRRNWRAMLAAAAICLLGAAASVLALGADAAAQYLLDVLPRMTAAFFNEPTNMSLWTLPARLGARWLPVWLLPAMALASLTWVAGHRRHLADQLALMTIASLLASPITWEFYLVLALVPLARTFAGVWQRGTRPVEVAATVAACGLLSVSQSALIEVGRAGAGAGILLLPTLGLCVLGALLASVTESLV